MMRNERSNEDTTMVCESRPGVGNQQVMGTQGTQGHPASGDLILICDDDKAILDALEIYLRHEGYGVVRAENGLQALACIAAQPDVIRLAILDIMMPQMDGLTAAMKIRETNNLPILMLSARSEDTDKILGLNFGADDYMTKPFNPLELLARVRSQLRRYTRLGGQAEKTGVIRTGSLELDTEAGEVRLEGEPIRLTATEYGIVRFLMQHLGRVFSIDQIYEAVWKEPSFSAENTVAVHIRRIREKIEINPKEPKYVKVVWGIGYRMERI